MSDYMNPVKVAMLGIKVAGINYTALEVGMPTTQLHALASKKRVIKTNMDKGMSALGYELRQDPENPFKFEFVKVSEPKKKGGKE